MMMMLLLLEMIMASLMKSLLTLELRMLITKTFHAELRSRLHPV